MMKTFKSAAAQASNPQAHLLKNGPTGHSRFRHRQTRTYLIGAAMNLTLADASFCH